MRRGGLWAGVIVAALAAAVPLWLVLDDGGRRTAALTSEREPAAEESKEGEATIKACYDRDTGALRKVDDEAQCQESELFISWNVQGIPGSQGPAGIQGPAGPQGPAGVKGDKGDIGLTGAKGDAGPAGAKGDTGATGAKGDQGPPGRGLDRPGFATTTIAASGGQASIIVGSDGLGLISYDAGGLSGAP